MKKKTDYSIENDYRDESSEILTEICEKTLIAMKSHLTLRPRKTLLRALKK